MSYPYDRILIKFSHSKSEANTVLISSFRRVRSNLSVLKEVSTDDSRNNVIERWTYVDSINIFY